MKIRSTLPCATRLLKLSCRAVVPTCGCGSVAEFAFRSFARDRPAARNVTPQTSQRTKNRLVMVHSPGKCSRFLWIQPGTAIAGHRQDKRWQRPAKVGTRGRLVENRAANG